MTYNLRYIFLDVDGVLNNRDSYSNGVHTPNGYTGAEDSLIERLKTLCSENTLIILTSDWKDSAKADVVNTHGHYLIEKLKEHGLYIHDMTEDKAHALRGNGVMSYLRNHDIDPVDGCYVIFDDHTFDFGNYSDTLYRHFVRTNSYYGLTDKDVLKAEDILSGHLRNIDD